ncbi:MAG: WD40 repeat domain-containing protein [Chloroflexota bacterium]
MFLLFGCLPDATSEVAVHPDAITAATIDQLELAVEPGGGLALSSQLSQRGDTLGVLTTRGVSIYQKREGSWVQSAFSGDNIPVDRFLISADGRQIALVEQESLQISVWEIETNRLINRLGEERIKRAILSFSSNGRYLSANSKHGITTWEIESGQDKGSIDLSAWSNIGEIKYSPNGELIGGPVASSFFLDRILLWNALDGKLIQELRPEGEGIWLAEGQFSPNGAYYGAIATEEAGNRPTYLIIWDLSTGQISTTIQAEQPIFQDGWAFAPQENAVAISYGDGTNKLWHIENGNSKLLFDLKSSENRQLNTFHFSPDGSQLFGLSDQNIALRWSLNDGEGGQIGEFDLAGGGLSDTEANHNTVVNIGINGLITLWDLEAQAVSQSIITHMSAPIQALAFSPDGGELAQASSSGNVVIWDGLESGRPTPNSVLPSQNARIDTLRFNNSGEQLLTGLGERVGAIAFDDTIRVWDMTAESNQPIIEFSGNRENVPGCSIFRNKILMSNSETVYAISHDYSVQIFNVASGQRINQLIGHNEAIFDMAINSDETRMYTASEDGRINLWDLPSGQLNRSIEGDAFGYTSLALSPDEKILAAGSNTGEILIYNARNGSLMERFDEQMQARASLYFSADGKLLIAPREGNQIGFWEVESGELLHAIEIGNSYISALTINGDGTQLAVGSGDGSVTWLTLPNDNNAGMEQPADSS